jgi:hypothetical protein
LRNNGLQKTVCRRADKEILPDLAAILNASDRSDGEIFDAKSRAGKLISAGRFSGLPDTINRGDFDATDCHLRGEDFQLAERISCLFPGGLVTLTGVRFT